MKNSYLNIVSFLNHDWEFEHRRPHYEALGKYARVLCVEPPFTIDSPLRYPEKFFKLFKRNQALKQIGENLYLCKPIALVPYSISLEFDYFKIINKHLMRYSLRKAVKKLNMRDIVSIICHPAQSYVSGMLDERVLCYEIYDNYSKFYRLSKSGREKIDLSEKDILKKADIVIATSRSLSEEKKRFNPNTCFIPNAADVNFFMKSINIETQIPDDLLQIPSPRIGLIGNINDIVDMELINYLAKQRPSWSIILIGKLNGSRNFMRSDAFMETRTLPNVQFFGWRPYETLPAYQKGIDVCLLPYLLNEFTVTIYPNKVHQYLAGGKPVVSTAMPEVFTLKDVVYIANGSEEFLNLCEQALRLAEPEVVDQRIAVARENTIETRAEKKAQLLYEALKRKNGVTL